jgi:3-methyladenine DNA glycosylase Mpg
MGSQNVGLEAPRDLPKLTSGPGRLAQAFGITRARDNGCDLASPRSGLWIGTDGFRAEGIRITPRIGITKAADQPLRYLLAGNAFVSGRRTPGQKTSPSDKTRNSSADDTSIDKWV